MRKIAPKSKREKSLKSLTPCPECQKPYLRSFTVGGNRIFIHKEKRVGNLFNEIQVYCTVEEKKLKLEVRRGVFRITKKCQ